MGKRLVSGADEPFVLLRVPQRDDRTESGHADAAHQSQVAGDFPVVGLRERD
jgi:hypothetical protein